MFKCQNYFFCAVVTSGGGGIGKAIAQYFLSQSKTVLLAGRTKSKLQASVNGMGAASYYALDVNDSDAIPRFVRRITKDHLDVDCVANNAVVQRPLEIPSDNENCLAKADNEIDINICGPLNLTMYLPPHLQDEAHLLNINMSSILGFFPFAFVNTLYNETKVWLYVWTMNLRTKLAGEKSPTRVVELATPTVGTDLHGERYNPGYNKRKYGSKSLTVEEIMGEAATKLERGDETISIGPEVPIVGDWFATFGKQYRDAELAM